MEVITIVEGRVHSSKVRELETAYASVTALIAFHMHPSFLDN